MYENILQENERVVKDGRGVYFKSKLSKAGCAGFLLTDRRLVVLKTPKANMLITTIIPVIFVVSTPTVFGTQLGLIEAALFGALVGGGSTALGGFITAKIAKRKNKSIKEQDVLCEFALEDITGIEDAAGRAGCNMMIITTKGGETHLIGRMKEKEEWRDAIKRSL